MTRDEWFEIARSLKSMYQQNDKFLPTVGIVDSWYGYLKDLNTGYVKLAVREYVKSERFPPTVGDITKRYEEIDERQKSRLRDLKEIFDFCHSCYPTNLWSEDDWAAFKDKIRSEKFGDALFKAERIKAHILNDRITGETPFKDYVKGVDL